MTSARYSRSSLAVAASLASSLLILITMYANYRIIVVGGGSHGGSVGNRNVANDPSAGEGGGGGRVGFRETLERSTIDASTRDGSPVVDDGIDGKGGGNDDEGLDVLEGDVRDLLDRNDEMRRYLIGMLSRKNDDVDIDYEDETGAAAAENGGGGRMTGGLNEGGGSGDRGRQRRGGGRPERPPQKRRTQRQRRSPEDDVRRNGNENLTGLNVLLLYADDWTHHTLSSYHETVPKNTILETPILDALASDGMRFARNCVTTSVCWISRATLYTGLYASRHNTTKPCCWGGMDKPKSRLDVVPTDWAELSVYELLAKAGYHVGHAGKWGIYMPFDKVGVHYNVEEDGWHYRKIGDKLWHITEKNEADALRFLVTRPRDRPFFLNVAFFATHAKDSDVRQYMPQGGSMGLYVNDTIPIPATATEEAWRRMPYFFDESNEGRRRWRARFENYTMHQTMMKNYYRMATEVDAACGAILEELRRQDALDNTVIIFTTDNGNFHAEHGLADKWYPHQESIRVPLIIRDPRMKDENRGTTNDDFTLNIDLAPTILGAAGLPIPQKMMGRDMSQLYLSPEPIEWREDFFYEHPMISKKSYVPSSEALVRKDYKYMFWPDYKYEQLFDLVSDPGEMADIFNSTDPAIAEIKAVMKKRFEELRNLVRSDEIVTL